MKKYDVIRQDLYDKQDLAEFTERLTDATANGFNVESCGIGGDTCRMGWAIMSKQEPDKPKKMDVLEAARMIAETCRKHGDSDLGCLGCPLSKGSQCLASGGLLPAFWLIAKED